MAMRWLAAMAAMLCIVALSATAQQSDLTAGLAAYGRGDYATAQRILRPLAEQGEAAAQNLVGVMYYLGHGIQRDDREAMRWYHRAAEQGLAEAQFNVGSLYFQGRGAAQDYVYAHMWVNLAAARLAGNAAEGARTYRDDVAAKMTPAQLAEAQAAARRCQVQQFKNCD